MHKQLRDPLYKIRFHFWRGPESALIAWAKKDGWPCDAHDGAARSINYVAKGYGQMVVHIWVAPAYSLRSPFGISALAHECVHAANAVFERIGAPVSLKWHEDEPYAYYVEWLVREFLRRMR